MHRFFFYLLILFLPTQVGYHFWPEWSVVLGRRVDYLSPTLFFTDVLLFLTVIFWLNSASVNFILSVANKYKSTLLLVSIFCFLNIISAQVPLLAITGWLKLLEYILLFLYIKDTNPSHSHMFIFLTLAVFYSVLLGITQTIHGGSIGGIFWFIGERTFDLSTPNIAKGVLCFPSYSCIEFLRPYATFPHPNVFAGFLVLYILLALRYRHTVFIAVSIFILILTLSRTAWFALSTVLLFVLLSKRFNLYIVYLLFVALLVFLTLLPLPFFNHESVDVRVALNQGAIRIITAFPMLGVGLKNFLISLPDALSSRTIYFLQPVHNIYLLLLSEIGITGSLLIGIFGYRLRNFFYHPSFIILILIVGFFDHYPLTLQQGQLILFLSVVYSTMTSWRSPLRE